MRRWVLLAVALTVATAVVLAVRDVRRAETALTEARGLVAAAREDLADGQVTEARDGLARAADRMASARRSVDGPLWTVGAALPEVGDGPRTVRRVVSLADAAIGIANTVVEQAAPALFEDGELTLALDDGHVDLQPMTALASVLDEVPVQPLSTARDRLASTGTTLVPPRLRAARQDALQLADELQGLLETGALVSEALPPFLGAEGPRTYLLALQNPAELRGTGGLIGLVGVVRFVDGAFSLVPPSELRATYDRLEDTDLPPADTSEAYARRYGARGGASLLQNTNLDPDLPTVATVLLDLWERRVAGRPPDGVIAIDPLLLADLVRTAGPLTVPPAFTQDARIPTRLSADDLLEVVSVDAYEVFGGDSPERKAFLEAVSTAALDRLSGGADARQVVDALVRNASERHLQVFSTDAGEQAAFRDLGIAGALRPPHEGMDLLAVTANNAGANKQDVHVGHAVDWDVRLEDLEVGTDDRVRATRRSTTSVLVANPLPTTGMHPWILESIEPGQVAGHDPGIPGLNRTWFSLWLPPEGEVVAGHGPDGPLAAASDVVHGQRAVDVFLETPSRSRRSFQLETVSPVALTVDDGRLRYRATLWRQAKAIPDDVRLVVHAPEGWRVATAELRGGGDGTRPELSTDPRPDDPEALELTVGSSEVTVRGQMTADAHLTVDLVPADG